MIWFALTPVIGGEMLASERYTELTMEGGFARAMGRLEERFAAKGHAFAAIGVSYRVDQLGPQLVDGMPLTEETLLGALAPEVKSDGQVVPVWYIERA